MRPLGRSLLAWSVPIILIWLVGGCAFDEKSIPMNPGELVRVPPPTDSERAAMAGSTRQWLTHTHRQLEHLLTERGKLALLTEQMTDGEGRPRDPYGYFRKDPANLNVLSKNWYGITHTAQAASRGEAIDEPAPAWPGFEQVWIPVAEGLELSGRLGFSEDGDRARTADCIVLLPGLFGDNAVLRTRDLAASLRTTGYHVLALELRGHGQTEARYPDVYYNFGVIETQDLMAVSEWLEDEYPQIRRTGLIGFCWGGNLAILAAWFDGREPTDPSIPDDLARVLDPVSPRRHFTAGAIAFSPVLRWEEILDLTDRPQHLWYNPSAYFFQMTVMNRMRRKGYREVSGSLRLLIAFEFSRSILTRSFSVADAYQSLRFLPYQGLPAGDRLGSARIPVLMVSSVNDPFLSAQDLPDLIAETSNPLVAGLMLRGGGHIGFVPYNPAYCYSLMVNFFDPQSGAAACTSE